MPPKPKYTKEEILDAAVSLVRERGEAAITSRDIGVKLGTSSRPIFTAFSCMAELRTAVIERGMEIFSEYQQRELAAAKYPPYKAVGMAYIRMARDDANLFRLLFMRDRTGEEIPLSHDSKTLSLVQNHAGISMNEANLFQTEMWVCVHGIATMLATSYLKFDEELISRILTDIFNGLRGNK